MTPERGWLVAFDDFLCARYPTCLSCGRRPTEGLDPFKCRVFSCCIGQLWLSYRLLVLSSATLGPGFGHHLPAR